MDASGLNQREQDFFDAFRRALDVAIGERVDVVFHTGDLFDSVRPTNRAISHVLQQVTRLHEAGIPFVVLSGNHEAPRLRETGAVLRLLEFVPGVHAAYKGRAESFRVGDLALHAVPHAASNDALAEELSRLRPDPEARFNVAGLHAGVLGVGDFRTGEFHEQVVPQNALPQGMDYVALGHYHRATAIADRVWYAGSTERCTFREAGETKSVNLVDLDEGTVTPLRLPTRPMLDLPPLRAQGLEDAAFGPALHAALEGAPFAGAIARLRVERVRAAAWAALDLGRVKRLAAEALHFELHPEIVRDEGGGADGAVGQTSLPDAFAAFLADRPLGGDDRDAVLTLARSLLHDAEAPG